jgi:hypothetical protein
VGWEVGPVVVEETRAQVSSISVLVVLEDLG